MSRFIKECRGFSLSETAIVLGIFGVILGSVWTITSTIRETSKRDAAMNQVVVIVKNIRDVYQSMPGIKGRANELPAILRRARAIPTEWLRPNSLVTGYIDHPWGSAAPDGTLLANGSMRISSAGDLAEALQSVAQSFYFEFAGLPFGACASLSKALAEAKEPRGMTGLSINSTSRFANIPFDLSEAIDWCDDALASSGATVRVTYSLRPNVSE